MPELSRFFGIVIRMYHESGEPHHHAHFHAYYGEQVAIYMVHTSAVRDLTSALRPLTSGLPAFRLTGLQARPQISTISPARRFFRSQYHAIQMQISYNRYIGTAIATCVITSGVVSRPPRMKESTHTCRR